MLVLLVRKEIFQTFIRSANFSVLNICLLLEFQMWLSCWQFYMLKHFFLVFQRRWGQHSSKEEVKIYEKDGKKIQKPVRRIKVITTGFQQVWFKKTNCSCRQLSALQKPKSLQATSNEKYYFLKIVTWFGS